MSSSTEQPHTYSLIFSAISISAQYILTFCYTFYKKRVIPAFYHQGSLYGCQPGAAMGRQGRSTCGDGSCRETHSTAFLAPVPLPAAAASSCLPACHLECRTPHAPVCPQCSVSLQNMMNITSCSIQNIMHTKVTYSNLWKV